MGHEHGHDGEYELSGIRLGVVTALNLTITVAEVLGGLLSGSLALLSDALHNLGDSAAIVTSWVAHRIAGRPHSREKTYGYKRAEVLAALFNALVLFGLSFFLIGEAYRRFRNPEPIQGSLMLTVAIVGLGGNLSSVYLLKRDSKRNMNIRSSYLHLLSDSISSVGVILGGVAIGLWNILWIDPLITVLISLYILRETWHIIKETVDILMQASPRIDYEELKKAVESVGGVKNLHHVHLWRSDERSVYFEGHVDVEDMRVCDAQRIIGDIQEILQKRFGIGHATIQVESDRCEDKEIVKTKHKE
ncbi:MAG: cation diffusion facilitator family transporter [Spirochaetes bacterium]|nr:cation diffusion facilitator family transporter [Spirochaetota bacterium]